MTAAESLAVEVLERLATLGVREFCVCPGARNAPFIAALKSSQLNSRYFYEERSAAFFALGRARRSSRPVAVITTSGTAAGELLPAAMEAFYTGVPLILVTADRPSAYRQTGAPQTAIQPGLYGVYAPVSLDLEPGKPVPDFTIGSQPLHLNVCFDEPLLSQASSPNAFAPGEFRRERPQASLEAVDEFLRASCNPIALVGTLAPEDRPGVEEFLRRQRIPAYLEAPSGLRERGALEGLRIHQADRLVERAEASGYAIDGVLRIGGIPTHRIWRDLEGKLAKLPVLSVSELPFTGLSRSNVFIHCAPGYLSQIAAQARASASAESWHREDLRLQTALDQLLEDEPLSEPGIFRALSRELPARAHVYVGNSLPIREWDLAAQFHDRGLDLTASRGLNGIDGQVSTFLGLCEEGRANWAILGDLTALYDLAGPWALASMAGVSARICVINNGGGRIFDRMFSHSEFQNPHQIRFKAWAELWGLPYESWERVPPSPSSESGLIEIRPDSEATSRFWQKHERL